MTEGIVEVVRIDKIEKHPDADSLEITHVYDYPVIVRLGDFKEGDMAIYVPIDSIVPLDDERFSFLKKPRIKAVRLRGVYSMGLLVPALPNDNFEEGQDVTEALNIKRWQPNEQGAQFESRGHSSCIPDPGYLIHYDLDGLLKYRRNLMHGEEIVITEKIEGENSRFLYHLENEEFYVASHGRYKELDLEKPDQWWQVAMRYNLEEKLGTILPDHGIYGEIYGHNKKYPYGHMKDDEISLMVFDILNIKTREWLDYDDILKACKELDLPVVPELYRGEWNQDWTFDDLMKFADGPSVVEGADHIREGMVVRTTCERRAHCGRMVFKMKGESYTLDKKIKKKKKEEN